MHFHILKTKTKKWNGLWNRQNQYQKQAIPPGRPHTLVCSLFEICNLLVTQHQSVVSFACCFQYALPFSRQKYTTVIHLLACKPFYTLSHKEGHIILENPVIWISKNLEAHQFETNIFHGLVTFFPIWSSPKNMNCP